MAIDSKHPQYDLYITDWSTLRDLHAGETVVKSKNETYLPATQGMHLDGMGYKSDSKPKPGQAAYNAYKSRAVFHDYVEQAVESLVGMLHQKPPVFELPEPMKPLLDKATLSGDSLASLLRRINSEQFLTGRIGLLADLPAAIPADKQATTIPYLASYIAEAIINWDEAASAEGFTSVNMVVLNESGVVRTNAFDWKDMKKFRVLQLGDITTLDQDGTAPYKAGVFTDMNNTLVYDPLKMVEPAFRGKTLKKIPFVFINTKDVVSTPDKPPLLALGRLTLAIYRGEADYRQTLFLTGQDTLVVVGGVKKADGSEEDDAVRTGAGSRIDVDTEGDAKYIGIQGSGLSEQREALINDKAQAESRAGKLIEVGKEAESGAALKTRLTAQTATLNQIALTGGKGLENALKAIAEWMGLDPAQVKVKPNMEFGEFDLKTQDIIDLVTARAQGGPISYESIHAIMVERGMTTLTFEEEMEKIQEENAALPPPPGMIGGRDPGVDPHLTNEDGTPMNKDQLQQQSEKRAEARDNRAFKRDSAAPKEGADE